MNYHDIRETELKNTKDFSDEKLRRYIKSHKILLKVSSEFFFWILSFIIFMAYPFLLDNTMGMYLFFLISHLIYWKWMGLKWYKKEMISLYEDIELTIQVLEDIQKEKHDNG
jgi:hypothetical protein